MLSKGYVVFSHVLFSTGEQEIWPRRVGDGEKQRICRKKVRKG